MQKWIENERLKKTLPRHMDEILDGFIYPEFIRGASASDLKREMDENEQSQGGMASQSGSLAVHRSRSQDALEN